MKNSETKDEILFEISEISGTPFRKTVAGGTILKEFFDDMAEVFEVPKIGSKTEVLSNCLRSVGLDWRPEYDSNRSPSGGGGTITVAGLLAVRNALIDKLNAQPEDFFVLSSVSNQYKIAIEDFTYNKSGNVPEFDPDLIADGFSRHNKTQNQLAAKLKNLNCDVYSPTMEQPQFDILWRGDSGYYVGEVKSLTPSNEESQLRKAVGQILRYQFELKKIEIISNPVIVVDKVLQDASWIETCLDNKIYLLNAPDFEGVDSLI